MSASEDTDCDEYAFVTSFIVECLKAARRGAGAASPLVVTPSLILFLRIFVNKRILNICSLFVLCKSHDFLVAPCCLRTTYLTRLFQQAASTKFVARCHHDQHSAAFATDHQLYQQQHQQRHHQRQEQERFHCYIALASEAGATRRDAALRAPACGSARTLLAARRLIFVHLISCRWTRKYDTLIGIDRSLQRRGVADHRRRGDQAGMQAAERASERANEQAIKSAGNRSSRCAGCSSSH